MNTNAINYVANLDLRRSGRFRFPSRRGRSRKHRPDLSRLFVRWESCARQSADILNSSDGENGLRWTPHDCWLDWCYNRQSNSLGNNFYCEKIRTNIKKIKIKNQSM